jgi:hypothetical protein
LDVNEETNDETQIDIELPLEEVSGVCVPLVKDNSLDDFLLKNIKLIALIEGIHEFERRFSQSLREIDNIVHNGLEAFPLVNGQKCLFEKILIRIVQVSD